jgi:trimethylamine--corrinoid protein Co-methyltransferase
MISMMRAFGAGVTLDAETLALDVIDKVGPGGDFLTQKHTLQHFRELWQPVLFDRRRYEEWQAEGSRRLGERLRERTVSLMETHQPEPLPDGVRDEIAYVLAQE